MSRWWRAYDEAVDDPKLCLLTDRQHRAWFNLCCITSQSGGVLPPITAIAFKLRMAPAKAASVVAELAALGLVDIADDGAAAPHNWGQRQYQSDVTDPTNATRQKRYRDRHAVTANTVTPTVTDKRPDTEQIQNREEDTPDGVPSPKQYAFESGVIRLTEADFNKWKSSFSHLDLAAELLSLTEWAETQPKWFYAVSGALAKRNREAKARAERPADSEFKWNGIPGVI